MNSTETIEKELTPSQKAKLKYYLKVKNDPEYKLRQCISSKKIYEKKKNDPDFKKQVSEQKKVYRQKIKDREIDEFFSNCL